VNPTQYRDRCREALKQAGFREYKVPRRCRECGGKYWVLHDDGYCQACVMERQARCRHIMETLRGARSYGS